MWRLSLVLAVSLWCGTVWADTTFDFNPITGRLDLTLDNSAAGVITGTTATFTGYNCSTNANGGALTTDSAGNLRCSDDDAAAGGADAITVNGSAATDANFADTPTIGWTLQTATSPDTISGIVVANSIGLAQLANSDLGDFTCDDTSCLVDANAIALSTDTTGNYVLDVADGTGIDGTAATEGATYTPTFDATELSTLTWGSGSGYTWTFDAGATDPTLAFASNQMTFSNIIVYDANATISGGLASAIVLKQAASCSDTTEGRVCWDADDDVLYSGTGTAAKRINGFLLGASSVTTRTTSFWSEPYGNSEGTTETTADQFQPPVNITCGNLQAGVQVAPGAGTSWAVSMNVAGTASTVVTCTIADTNTSCTDTTGTASIASTQSFNFEWLASGAVTGSDRHEAVVVCTFD